MRFCVVAVGQRMPAWVDMAWTEYSRRFPRSLCLDLREVPAVRRGRNPDIESIRRDEGQALLAAAPASACLVALEEKGRQWSTGDLAAKMREWMQLGRDVAFLVGGPDGLSKPCLDQSDHHWSLGSLTFPHALVRVVLAEQIYRAWTITQNHPYHRD